MVFVEFAKSNVFLVKITSALTLVATASTTASSKSASLEYNAVYMHSSLTSANVAISANFLSRWTCKKVRVY